jgi:EAL domain-containing protein (putative c-di-GMP-specific phosphodiesterase class I)
MPDGSAGSVAAPKFDPASLKVLIIDDQSHVRTYVHTVLKNAGVSDITEAGDGAQALAAVTQPGAFFDLILCDLRMPERDGIETIRALASLGVQSAIAIMSVEEERVIETAGLLAEMQGLRLLGTVHKPLTAEKLDALFSKMRESAPRTGGDAAMAPAVDLPEAFAREQFRIVYQPKVAMRTGAFAGVEALVRWKHPTLGVLLPASFLPLIESSAEHSASLAEFTLSEAIACAGHWRTAGRELRVAINLTARAFDRLDLPERLNAMCVAQGVEPESITLEVTESDVERDAVRLIDVATRLRLKGFTLSIDDFGTGRSGTAKLQRLPFSELKIDRQFVDGCSRNGAQRSVVETSLALARSLKMNCVAEGVQDRPDWDLLNQLGCDVMQGYFIARPMSEEGLEAWAMQWMLRGT